MDPNTTAEAGGCGCNSAQGPSHGALAVLVLLGLATLRRRRLS
jgi:MYXO-CTERM domain-containing protein